MLARWAPPPPGELSVVAISYEVYMKRCALYFLLLLIACPVAAQEEPAPLNVYNGEIPAGERTFFVAPNGEDDAAGTEEEPWATLDFAVTQVERGDVVVMRGGIYEHDETIRIQTPSGYFGELITVVAYPGEVPILEFASQPKQRDVHGIRLNANWWRLIGLTLRNASHNGIRIDGSYNILEQITAYGNHDTGIHMAGGASYNLIKNSDSFRNFNYDPARNNGAPIGGNADGFSAKFEIGPGNRYVGCRAWENSDDGWDFWEAENTIVIDSSWAFGNGDAAAFNHPAGFNGNGNGFKLGGNYVVADHIVRRSLAFKNFGSSGNAKGFDYNNNPGAMTLIHNTAYDNGRNFYFPLSPPSGQAAFLNNLSIGSSLHAQLPPDAVIAGNSWQADSEITTDMLMSVDVEAATSPREADGSLPQLDFLRPAGESFLVDGGVSIGEPFYGAAPDMGAFEMETGGYVEPWIDRGTGASIADLKVFDLEHAADWSIVDDIQEGDPAYGGSDETLMGLPESLTVHDWIRPSRATSAKHYLFEAARFVLTQDAFVLVAHADAIDDKPEWLAEYTETGATLAVAAAGVGEHWLTIFQREASAGDTISLGRNSLDGAADAPMYLAMVGGPANVKLEDALPRATVSLEGIHPNPVLETATVSFRLDRGANVLIQIYDALGRRVTDVASGFYPPGDHALRWDASVLPAGVYYCRLRTDGFVAVTTLVRQ